MATHRPQTRRKRDRRGARSAGKVCEVAQDEGNQARNNELVQRKLRARPHSLRQSAWFARPPLRLRGAEGAASILAPTHKGSATWVQAAPYATHRHKHFSSVATT